MEFQEKYKIDAFCDSTGSTTEQVSPYYDMLGMNRIDFIIQGKSIPSTARSTAAQKYQFRLLQASNATGGGATGISSATAVMGKLTATGVVVALADKANEVFIQFTTVASGATFSVAGYQYSFDSTAVLTSRIMDSTGATAQASVAAEAFVTCFNSTANNPVATVWTASTVSSALVRIGPYNVNAQTTYLTATGSTLINVGIGRTIGHLGVDAQYLSEGKRYVAIAVQSSNTSAPFAVTAFREVTDAPSNNINMQVSKSLAGSTGK